MTKEELRDILKLCCDSLNRNKDTDLEVDNNIEVKKNIMTPWGKYGTKYRYTIKYQLADQGKTEYSHLTLFNIDKWHQDEHAQIKFGKMIIKHLWEKVKRYKNSIE